MESKLPIIKPEPATAGLAGDDTQVGSVFVSNYPPFSAWSAAALPAMQKVLAEPPATGVDFGLYFHIPFCRKRCKFCYFRVYTDKNAGEIGRYCDALAREVELYGRQPAVADRTLRFVYFGGGTPSYISVKHLERLVARARAALPWEGVDEVTFECEPGTLTRTRLEAIKRIGVTRLSLGIENFDDRILEDNGRAHSSEEIFEVWPWIEELAFDQVNVDLISGMVGETEETWRRTVAKTIELAPDSVTIYQMELPYNTRFSKLILVGEMERPVADWRTKRGWHDYAFGELEAAGYELSSAYTMVKTGKPCRFVYRDSLWRGADMIGTGVASFGHLSGIHFQNVDGWNDYLEALEAGRLPLARGFQTSADDRLTREVILQLKRGRLDAAHFAAKYGVDVRARFASAFGRLQAEGMVVAGDGDVELTRSGLLQVDSLLPTFYDDRYRNARYT